jgi:ABC-2 type transport system permease protein
MRTFLYFISKEWMHIWRDKRTLFILFGMPVAQMLIFGFALTNEVKNSRISILDPSKDQYSTRLVERISASHYFDLQENLHSPADIDKAFKKGDIRAAIIFPEHFTDQLLHSKSVTIQIIADASDPNIATTVTNYANAIIRDFQDDLLNNPDYPYTIQTNVRMLYNPQLKGAFNFVPGVMSMILLLVCTMMTSVSIVREKELGTMEVLLASPSRPGLVITAKALPYLFLSIINICTILLLSVFVLELPIRGSLVLLMTESILFIITALSLGLLISIITDSQRTAMFISLVGMFLPTLMLSGFMFPIENMPKPLQIISNIVAAKWYFIIVKAVMLKGLGLAAIWKETLILFGMTLFLLLLAMKKFKIRL